MAGDHMKDGNVGGAADVTRIHRLQQQRVQREKEVEAEKLRLAKESDRKIQGIHDKFGVGGITILESELKKETIGLVTKENFQKIRDEKGLGDSTSVIDTAAKNQEKSNDKKFQKKKKLKKNSLSFGDEEEEGNDDVEDTVCLKKPRLKNPDVNTEFLPDREREEANQKEREELKSKFLAEQDAIRKEKLEITYSYWDGAGHRRTVVVTKGATIFEFLELARRQLQDEFRFVYAFNLYIVFCFQNIY